MSKKVFLRLPSLSYGYGSCGSAGEDGGFSNAPNHSSTCPDQRAKLHVLRIHIILKLENAKLSSHKNLNVIQIIYDAPERKDYLLSWKSNSHKRHNKIHHRRSTYPLILFSGHRSHSLLVHFLEPFQSIEQVSLVGFWPWLGCSKQEGSPVNVLAIRWQ